MSTRHIWSTTASITSSVSAPSSLSKARELFLLWALSMPAGASFSIEANKLLNGKDSFWDAVPKELHLELRDMFKQVTQSLSVLPRGRRGARRNKKQGRLLN